MTDVSPLKTRQYDREPNRCPYRTDVHLLDPFKSEYVFERVLLFRRLASSPSLVQDKRDDEDGLKQKPPTDSENFVGLDAHNPCGHDGSVADRIE